MRHEKDLATSKPEFYRNLGIAMRGKDYTASGDRITVGEEGHKVEMQLSSLPPRVLSGLLRVERWKLEMEFTGYSQDQYDAFLTSFDQAFRRGGG